MPHVYSILGCGRQGAAAAYDLALRGDASEIRLIDADMGSATRTAERLLRLLGPPPVASRPGRGPRAAERRLRLAGSAAPGARVAGAGAVPALRPVRCGVR